MSITSALRWYRQRIKVICSCIGSSRSAWATGDPVSKTSKYKTLLVTCGDREDQNTGEISYPLLTARELEVSTSLE